MNSSFKQLPRQSFGFSDFGAEGKQQVPKPVSEFFGVLRDALSELEQAYEVLLNSV